MLEKVLIGIYALSSFLILLYTLSQLYLFFLYLKNKDKEIPKATLGNDLPLVTIQLPLFNEKYVVERLLENMASLDYPIEKLQIQVLDDSTDESLMISEKKVIELKKRGFDIDLLHRTDRSGYKAGALKNALIKAKGEFIAIFDADFLPEKDWLKQTLPYFTQPQIGVVQTRWKHLNRDYSLLTQAQALALDHHFTIEQAGRNSARHYINFNGTAGIWRKQCILDAGNWEGDTLTEDLDLSYRAQLKNWEFRYIESIGTPSELPVTMGAIKSQQFRWNKGGAENLLKHFKNVVLGSNIPFKTRISAFFHLFNSSIFVWAFCVSVLSVPIMLSGNSMPLFISIPGLVLKFSFVITFLFFFSTFVRLYPEKRIAGFIIQYLAFFPIVLGMTFHNAKAVAEAYLGKKTAFVRTPKFNILTKADSWRSNVYNSSKINLTTVIEFLLAIYFAFGLYYGISHQMYGFVPFHLMLCLGYSIVFIKAINE
jgi:cellulose synthase/poly-beta-1,6-N-acetylglucosamine synthase-like glycosyltransferase